MFLTPSLNLFTKIPQDVVYSQKTNYLIFLCTVSHSKYNNHFTKSHFCYFQKSSTLPSIHVPLKETLYKVVQGNINVTLHHKRTSKPTFKGNHPLKKTGLGVWVRDNGFLERLPQESTNKP